MPKRLNNNERCESEERAATLLVHYFRTVFEASGLTFDSDNEIEVREIISYLVEAIK